ncbi:zinc-binding dehydrogenase [Streptomyces aurantiogriseus]|uniref:zinc-binding dehydrogenase n=1 Tax=Streptomyces aurantiogriseus TaxID=66870 RepID=UPI0016771D52
MRRRPARLRTELAEEGRLRARIDTTSPLAETAKAHAHGETGRTTGKIVLVVRRVTAPGVRRGPSAGRPLPAAGRASE